MQTNSVSINEELRQNAIEEVLKTSPSLRRSPMEFIQKVSQKFLENQLDAFPRYCEIAKWQNFLKWQELKETSTKGKYTDSMGWSAKREFKFDYEIPEDLYLFMVNLVYKDFWSDSNERVWRKFMKRVCDASMHPTDLLVWVKKIYGPNSQEGIVLN